jgi:hypothetical protein
MDTFTLPYSLAIHTYTLAILWLIFTMDTWYDVKKNGNISLYKLLFKNNRSKNLYIIRQCRNAIRKFLHSEFEVLYWGTTSNSCCS